jgi:hypothetical protein
LDFNENWRISLNQDLHILLAYSSPPSLCSAVKEKELMLFPTGLATFPGRILAISANPQDKLSAVPDGVR